MANLDKPVHKVLEDYDLLNVSVIQNNNTINMSAAMLWRMNLCATSNEIPCTFFVAMNYRVNVYTIDTAYSPFKNPCKVLASPNARSTGGASESPYIINSIKIDRLLQTEVLVTTSENGEVCIWRTEHLDEPPMILSNEVATWGIAIHADQGLVAVSGNNWRITVFNILEMTRENPIFGTRNKNMMGKELQMELIGHEHNIPNIDFSETGQYIASASIDQTCRVWDITTKKVITQKKTPISSHGDEQDAWFWSVKFIKPGNFKHVACIDKNISNSFLQRIYQGRSTSLSNLGLSHSAVSPLFPSSISNVYDLGDEDIDFTDEVDISVWDNVLSQEEEELLELHAQETFHNHSEISEDSNQDSDETQESDPIESDNDAQAYNFENPFPPTDSIESLIQDEIEFEYLFNQRIRDAVLSQENPAHEDIDYDMDDGDLQSDDNSIDIEPLPTQEDWARSIIDDDLDENRDGWGDEIVSVTHQDLTDQAKKNNHIITTKIEKTKVKQQQPIGEYLMVSTGKDIMMLSTSIPKMNRIRAEHDIISKVDVRSDQLLSVLDRINMVEWLPELELYVAASQKGTVALVRILQVEFEGGEQACIFNNECYLPTNVFQSTPLYGMTVKRIESERFTPISYQIFLFYYSGNVLGYTISRNDCDIMISNFIV